MTTPRIAVCIATFHRANGLERALRSVLRQNCLAQAEIHIIVVNNDPNDPQPNAVVTRLQATTTMSLKLVDEAERGPAHARNRALREVHESCDFIAFLDDDEEAPEDWLASLLRVKAEYAADIVTGGIVPIFEEPPPTWAIEGGFYARPTRPTGTVRPWAFTGNVLFDAALLHRLPSWFDPRFTQGEDRHFFARLAATGARIVWCDASPPREYVPAARVDRTWLAQRMRNIGRAVTAIEQDTPRANLAVPRNLAKGTVWILLGTAQQLAGWCTDEARAVRGRMHRAYGVGLIEGACGLGGIPARGD